mmetsp:Transcript_50641/g.151450  ORF Transcript_50641/g.151450 Transcript_50641/m.151450 type:complete len:216 (-) Transcript_50641:83-730(-)
MDGLPLPGLGLAISVHGAAAKRVAKLCVLGTELRGPNTSVLVVLTLVDPVVGPLVRTDTDVVIGLVHFVEHRDVRVRGEADGLVALLDLGSAEGGLSRGRARRPVLWPCRANGRGGGRCLLVPLTVVLDAAVVDPGSYILCHALRHRLHLRLIDLGADGSRLELLQVFPQLDDLVSEVLILLLEVENLSAVDFGDVLERCPESTVLLRSVGPVER